jgi:predicted TIM-barrel fold metal-dependent hydrolase
MTMRNKPTDFSKSQPPNEQWLAHAIAEDAIEPDLPIVDTHMHLFDRGPGNRYFIEEYARDLITSGHNVAGTIYVECGSMYRTRGPDLLKSVGEVEFAVGMAAMAASGKYTSALVAAGIVANADPLMGEAVAEVLDAHSDAANGRLRGVRRRGKWDADPAVRGTVGADRPGIFLEPVFHRGLREVAKRRLAFEASVFHPQIPDVTAMARAVPEASIVLLHTGSPLGHSSYAGREAEVHAHWLAAITALATCPNVTVKLGGLLMSLANFDFGIAPRPPTSEELLQLWRPYLEPCLELFGAGRCMVSSNFPVEKAGVGYGTTWNLFKLLTRGCSNEEKQSIFNGTAGRIYQI